MQLTHNTHHFLIQKKNKHIKHVGFGLVCFSCSNRVIITRHLFVVVVAQGCLYDGKFYNETQAVHTKEPCLNCSCQTGALRCHLQVCPFLHDIYPPPAGCVLVERKNACCPKLHCRKCFSFLKLFPFKMIVFDKIHKRRSLANDKQE